MKKENCTSTSSPSVVEFLSVVAQSGRLIDFCLQFQDSQFGHRSHQSQAQTVYRIDGGFPRNRDLLTLEFQ